MSTQYAHPLGHRLERVDVAQHRLAAARVELRDAVGLDVALAGEAELLLDGDLDRQAVAVPAGLAGDVVALHRPVAREDVLERRAPRRGGCRACRWPSAGPRRRPTAGPSAVRARLLANVSCSCQKARTSRSIAGRSTCAGSWRYWGGGRRGHHRPPSACACSACFRRRDEARPRGTTLLGRRRSEERPSDPLVRAPEVPGRCGRVYWAPGAALFLRRLRGDLRPALAPGLPPSPGRSGCVRRLLVPINAVRGHRTAGVERVRQARTVGASLTRTPEEPWAPPSSCPARSSSSSRS